MSSVEGGVNINSVKVFTTEYRGFTPEEIASRALDRIISVGENSHPLIVEQAKAYRSHIYQILVHYLREAQQSERTTICGKLNQNGFSEIAQLIGEL